MQTIYHQFLKQKSQNKKSFAVLIDPDSTNEATLFETIQLCNAAAVDFIFVGGSLITNGYFAQCIDTIKAHSNIQCIIFPGNHMQVHPQADALLLLSLISGRNADLLIGNHVQSSFLLKQSQLELIPTGYMLIDGGRSTSVSYMSNTQPIPSDKNTIASSTALAGVMLGLKLIYLDAGSGALHPVPVPLISAVRDAVGVPLIVGGGIKDSAMAVSACAAGADLIVIGNALEKDPSLISIIAKAVHQL